jgi:CRP/FNR family transcriptional regulator
MRALMRLMGVTMPSTCRIEEPCPLMVCNVGQDAPLMHEGAALHTLYVVRTGSLKTVKTLVDGYEQLLSLALPGDLLGFEALHHGSLPASVVALEDSTVYALPVSRLQELRQNHPLLDYAIHRTLSRQLVHAAEAAELMSAVASDVRLARFLLWMSGRMVELGQSPRRLLLRLSRRDIASLLGVAHETVSRAFTNLADEGCIKVDNRDVELLDMERLAARACSTRGLSVEPRPRARRNRNHATVGVSSSWFGTPEWPDLEKS